LSSCKQSSHSFELIFEAIGHHLFTVILHQIPQCNRDFILDRADPTGLTQTLIGYPEQERYFLFSCLPTDLQITLVAHLQRVAKSILIISLDPQYRHLWDCVDWTTEEGWDLVDWGP
ncbi:MAG: hypothetical protein Q6M54_00955, partial [Thermostichus sp. DRC_bins_24]